MTYTHHDHNFADRLKAELHTQDFGIFSALERKQEKDSPEITSKELLHVSRLGAILPIVSVKSVQTIRQRIEIEIATQIQRREDSRSNIIQVFRDEPSAVLEMASDDMREAIENLKSVDFSTGSFQENVDGLMQMLREYEWSN